MGNMRRALTMTMGTMIAAGTLATLAGPAQAAPSGCTYTWGGGKSLTVACATGDGSYRAKAVCVRTNQIPTQLNIVGPWAAAGPGTRSTAVCPLNSYTYRGGVEFA
ncbi:hypothetical protein [Actinomadura macrotermitis]|uniref:Uncharacterized protein n=1 Tax=Actinomadura macrotermitis TaxID=2585200 RepID=A0A7K0C6Z1_9ACTN|nr:hypothetical protein [Actinomadura macrotermitis]MQY09239.1 hypothetical protein [Actinomadura macrotermitis]